MACLSIVRHGSLESLMCLRKHMHVKQKKKIVISTIESLSQLIGQNNQAVTGSKVLAIHVKTDANISMEHTM